MFYKRKTKINEILIFESVCLIRFRKLLIGNAIMDIKKLSGFVALCLCGVSAGNASDAARSREIRARMVEANRARVQALEKARLQREEAGKFTPPAPRGVKGDKTVPGPDQVPDDAPPPPEIKLSAEEQAEAASMLAKLEAEKLITKDELKVIGERLKKSDHEQFLALLKVYTKEGTSTPQLQAFYQTLDEELQTILVKIGTIAEVLPPQSRVGLALGFVSLAAVVGSAIFIHKVGGVKIAMQNVGKAFSWLKVKVTGK
jgi:hypothetical protein